MKNQINLYLFIIICIVSMASCSQSYYMPSQTNTPLLSEKDETKVQVNLHSSENMYGAGLQFSKAVTDKVGIISSAQFSTWEYNSEGSVDLGAGVFKKIGRYGVVEGYGGLGLGINDGENEKSFTYVKAFLQPNIGFKSKYFEFALGNRIAVLRFNNKISFNSDDYRGPTNSPYVFYEPSFMIKGGVERIKFFTKVQSSMRLNQKYFNREETVFSLGLEFNINKNEKK